MNPTPTATTAQTIRSFGEAAIRLADALAHAQEVQHDRPAAPSLRQEDTSRRASVVVSDPTGSTVADPHRLRLRAAVISGEVVADELATKAHEAAEELELALQSWAGSRW